MVILTLDLEEDPVTGQQVFGARLATAKPYQQGQLDGLCGLYSVINALAVLGARGRPVRHATCRRLFQRGLSIIAADMPLEEAILHGIEPDLWFRIVTELAEAAGKELGLVFQVDRPLKSCPRIGKTRLREEMETALDSLAVLLIGLERVHQHYTLIVGHNPTRYVLHDSGPLRWLHKAACGAEGSGRRHEIAAQWVLAVRVVDPKPD